MTANGDEFGVPIPYAIFTVVGNEEIGKAVVDCIGNSAVVLLKNHGVFTVGKDARAAVKAAVMTEDAAVTVWMALQIGKPDEIPPRDIGEWKPPKGGRQQIQ